MPCWKSAGDIAIGEPGAIIGFAGARVIGDTIREKLPEGFQRAEYLLEHGMIDMVVPRKELRDTLIRILGLLQNPTPAAEIVPLTPSEAPLLAAGNPKKKNAGKKSEESPTADE